MPDGLNQARAMRIAELMSDFRNIQNYLASIRLRPSVEEQNEEGFVLLGRCMAEAQALLAMPFQASVRASADGRGGDEERRGELRRILVDAAVRRFRAQKLYLRAVAVLRWVNARQAILSGQQPQAGHAGALAQLSNQLRAEIAATTDTRVEASLRQPDESVGKWLVEDPGLALMQRIIANGGR